MRRLILEVRSDEIRLPDPSVQSVELLHLLDATVENYAAIWRIRLRKISRPRSNRRRGPAATQREILGTEADGSLIVYSKGRHSAWIREQIARKVDSSGTYIDRLFNLERGKITMGLAGSSPNLRAFLKELARQGIPHKVLWLGKADLPESGPLSRLTVPQRKLIGTAYSLGYYAIPRQIDISGLSRAVGLARATVDVHLRRAEAKLVAEALADTRPHPVSD
jgi:hypothetical protein